MAESTESRKLVAVMFADIEGYTSSFQEDEKSAMQLIDTHRKDLEEITLRHQGRIAQYYGDGSVTVYDSVIEAIRCATELQQISISHGIPLRIGIHLGDLIFKDDDIYGDAINIASRIQSMGVSGSILVSHKVDEELKNHPEIHTRSLGKYRLKNIKKPFEIYALTNPGFVIPQHLPDHVIEKPKSWMWIAGGGVIFFLAFLVIREIMWTKGVRLGDECIIIPPFQNFTSRSELDHLGDLASSYLSKALSETSEVEIISYESGLLYTNADMASLTKQPALARRTGADIMLNGSYSLTGRQQDSLRFWVSFLDLRSRPLEIIIPEVQCHADNPMVCMDQLANLLKGYWRSREDAVFQVPNDRAYTAYVKAQKIWADPATVDKAKNYLVEAIHHDSLFIDAWFLLLNGFINQGAYGHGTDTLNTLKQQVVELNDRQENYVRFMEADLEGKNQLAFNYFMNEYALHPNELFINTTGMVMSMEYLNDPVTTLKFHRDISMDSLDLHACAYCITRVNMAMQAFMQLEDMKSAGELAERMRSAANRSAHYVGLIGYYIRLGDTLNVNQVIRSSMVPDTDDEQYYSLIAARLAKVAGRNDLAAHYARRAVQLYGKETNRTRARCHLVLGEWKQAEKIYLEEMKREPENNRLYAELGIVYARQDRYELAQLMIEKLQSLKEEYDFGETPYFIARIKANAGRRDEAVQDLKTALAEGAKFQTAMTFLEDPDMVVMQDYPAYMELVNSLRIIN